MREPTLSAHKRVLDAIALLPSETTLYFLIYLVFAGLAVAYTVTVPAVVLFFSENHPVLGTVFVAAHLGLFAFVLRLNLRRRSRPPDATMAIIRWRQQARRIPLALLRTPIGWLMKRLAPPAFEPYPDQHGKTSFGRFFRDLWIEVAEPGWPEPALWWAYQDGRPEARVAGTREHPVIAVAAGLMRRYPADADLVRVYLFHEFGHLASGDLSLFAWTTSLNTACQVMILSAAASSIAYALRFLNGDFLSALVLLVGILWVATLAITSLYLLRFAGVLISLRELQADIWAVSRLADFAHFEKIVSDASPSRRGSRLRSFFSMRLRHLSAQERLDLLRRPLQLLTPRLRYFMLTGFLLALLQSNPFGEGVGRNSMRLPFLLAWAPLAVAYFGAAYRETLGFALLRERLPVSRCAALAAGATVVVLLPFLKLPGLYGNVLLSFGSWRDFRATALDSLSIMVAQWSHAAFLLVPAASIAWALAAAHWGRRALPLKDQEPSRKLTSALYRRSLRTATFAIMFQLVAFGLVLYDSDRQSLLDPILLPLYYSRPFVPLLPYLIMFPALLWSRPSVSMPAAATSKQPDY